MLTRPFLAPALVVSALALAGCQPPAPPAATQVPLGMDLGAAPGRTPIPPAPVPTQDNAHQHDAGPPAVPGHGTVDAVDAARRRVTLNHDPIPQIGWPAMTMVFQAAPAVDLTKIRPGDHVDFSLTPGPGGTYGLTALQAAHP